MSFNFSDRTRTGAFNMILFFKLNRLLWSFQIYIVNIAKRPTKACCLIQLELVSFNQVFEVLTLNKHKSINIQYCLLHETLGTCASSLALVVLYMGPPKGIIELMLTTCYLALQVPPML